MFDFRLLQQYLPGADVSLSVLATRCLHGASASSKILASSKSGVPKTLGGPAVNRGEQIASFSALALVAPETGKIARCSQAPKKAAPNPSARTNACRKLVSTPSVSRSNEAPAPRERSRGSPLLERAFGYLEPLARVPARRDRARRQHEGSRAFGLSCSAMAMRCG